MTQWQIPDTPLCECFKQLCSGVIIVENNSNNVIYCNPAFEKFIGDNWPEVQKTYTFKDVISLSKGNPRKTTCEAEALDGFILHTDKEQEPLRIKLKPNTLTDNLMLYLIDPYSEEQAISQAHSDFVSVVSHEFRTPLTSIKGFADTMLRYGGQLPPEQQTRFTTIIKDQADRLTRMVENLLTASKQGAGKGEVAYRANDLKKMVDKVVENIMAKGSQDQTYANREVKVDMASNLPEVWADQDKLEQVMTNLIDNAVKYSFPNSTVMVKATAENDNKSVRASITNEGIGIPAEHLPQIFTKFSRVDNPLTRQVEGTGLGLYITKSMVNSMGGKISVESEPDKETSFTVMLKAATAELQERYHQEVLKKEGDDNQEATE